MFELKPLSKDAIPSALEKAMRYRLLNEPGEAESICLDVLRIDPENQQVLVILLLALTDRFAKGYGVGVTQAREILARLRDPYERARVRMLEDTSDQYVYSAVRGLAMSQFEFSPPYLIRRKPETVDHRTLEESRAKVHEHLARLDSELSGRTWFGGTFSLADAALAPPLTGMLRLLGILPDQRYPNILAWTRRIAERPSYLASAPKQPLSIKES